MSDFDLDNPQDFIAASNEVAVKIADSLHGDFARVVDGKVYVSTDVLTIFAQAHVVNGMEAGFLNGDEEGGIALFKTAITLNAVVEEAKSRVGV